MSEALGPTEQHGKAKVISVEPYLPTGRSAPPNPLKKALAVCLNRLELVCEMRWKCVWVFKVQAVKG